MTPQELALATGARIDRIERAVQAVGDQLKASEEKGAIGLEAMGREVLRIARSGARRGCHEALFTLGEAPEDRYPVAAEWLARRGYTSTVDYVVAAATAVRTNTDWSKIGSMLSPRGAAARIAAIDSGVGALPARSLAGSALGSTKKIRNVIAEITISRITVWLGSVAKSTRTTMFQQAGKPAKLLSLVFILVSAK